MELHIGSQSRADMKYGGHVPGDTGLMVVAATNKCSYLGLNPVA